MVDALLSAAAESESSLDDGYHIMEVLNDGYSLHHRDDGEREQPPLRFCEFCNSSNTPTWRRGPAGKGSLCNACGIKWRLRKRLKKNEKGSPPSPSPPSPTIPDKKVSPFVIAPTSRPPKKRKQHDVYSSRAAHSNSKREEKHKTSEFSFSPPLTSAASASTGRENKRKKYYCKYCDQTFSLSQFRNSQQFGAHCSNCSRRPRVGEENVYEDARDNGGSNTHYRYNISPYSPVSSNERSSPSTPESPTPSPNPNRNGLLLRLLHVVEHQLVDVHELAEIRGELSSLKTELVNREEERKAELGIMRSRFKEDLADLRMGLRRSVAAHEQLAAHRLMEMEQAIRIRGSLMF